MFKNLIGNDNVKQRLRHLLTDRRLPNSLLFAGDDGVGKQQFALEIARAFVCRDEEGNKPCGVCSACTRVGGFVVPPEPTDKNKGEFEKVFFGQHLDVGKVVKYRRTILVDAIRDLERNANFQPYESPARFFIVDEADRMNAEASNALLKTLEEPASTSFIFLITSRPDALLPTIRSRCQTLRFAPVAIDEIERYLIDEQAFSHDEAKLAARLSRGSVGRAMSINVEEFREQRQLMLDAVRCSLLTGDAAALLRISEEMNDAKRKDRFEDNLDILESLIHDIWTLRKGGDTSRIVNTDIALGVSELAERAGPHDLAGWLTDIEELRRTLAVNVNRRVATDSLFTSMAAG
jgi:DNA polymerase III subunit delta'